MLLYTCPAGTHGASAPLIKHPCGVAAAALDAAGHSYELRTVGGFKNIPLSRRGKRAEIIALSGQQDVPLLVLDDGATVQGSGEIASWAAAHPAATSDPTRA
jgi:glutathione S-transferase